MNRWDKIVTASIIVLALAAMAVVEVFAFHGSGDTVIVSVDGVEQARFNYRGLAEPIVYVCDTQYGHNTVVIDNRGAGVTESDCADRTEIKQGRITKANTSLVCLPNRLVVQIIGGRADADIVSY